MVPKLAPQIHEALGSLLAGWAQHIALRTAAIDDIVREAVGTGADQVVILGAGLDSRALRLSELRGMPVYEIDRPASLRYKADRLCELGVQVGGSTPVPMVLGIDSLAPALVAAGFRPGERSLWLVEGLSVYLTRDVIGTLLQEVSDLCVSGSIVALTYVRRDDPCPRWFRFLSRGVAFAVREPFRSLLDAGELRGFVQGAGFDLRSDEGRGDWVARYWPGQTGGVVLERVCVLERLGPRTAP
jgi:methyltransferase (TIGR00027 family)